MWAIGGEGAGVVTRRAGLPLPAKGPGSVLGPVDAEEEYGSDMIVTDNKQTGNTMLNSGC